MISCSSDDSVTKIFTMKAFFHHYSLVGKADRGRYDKIFLQLGAIKQAGYLDKLLYISFDGSTERPEFYFKFKDILVTDFISLVPIIAPYTYILFPEKAKKTYENVFIDIAERFELYEDEDLFLIISHANVCLGNSLSKGDWKIIDFKYINTFEASTLEWRDE